MKKTITILLAFCLCIGICACGGKNDSSKCAEAQKADELILSIGIVTLDKEASILAAKAFYDTLTNEQKAQVENAAFLEAAVSALDSLKTDESYKQIYNEAVELEENAAFQSASEKYATLPVEYKDVALRHSVTTLLAQLSGTWTCDNRYAKSNKGTVLVTWAAEIKFTPENGGYYKDNPEDGKTVVFTVNHSLHAFNNGDTAVIDSFTAQVLKDISSSAQVVPQKNGGYNVTITSKLDGTYICVVTHRLRADGKLEVTFEYSTFRDKTNITSATYIYSKMS